MILSIGFWSNLKATIYYAPLRARQDTITIEAVVVDRRYEIEVFSEGSTEVEVFENDGSIGGQVLIGELPARYSESQ